MSSDFSSLLFPSFDLSSALSAASELDSADELSSYRSSFTLPRASQISLLDSFSDADAASAASASPASPSPIPSPLPLSDLSDSPAAVYLTGNSLGAQPIKTRDFIACELNKWSLIGVEGHFHGSRPWARIEQKVAQMSEKLFGGQSGEVAIANSLSLNLHLLLLAFYRPSGKRRKILMESSAFCSDHHIVRSQVRLHGLEESDAIIALQPRSSEHWIRGEDIETAIQQAGDELALVLLPGVQFYTGQLFNLAAITAAAHKVGALAAFDLAHAVGNVTLQLHEWGVDFAAWCCYKYLNAGPGAIGGLFVHNRHDKFLASARLLDGWWGQPPEAKFQMLPVHERAIGAQAFQLSNPSVLSCVCLEASLELFISAGADRLRQKSIRLTAFLERLLRLLAHRLDSSSQSGPRFLLITPPSPSERGCQLSILFDCDASAILKALLARGVVGDFRRPNVIRVAPTPLYNSFTDCAKFVLELEKVIDQQSNTQ